jgi:hypothetical protein
MSIVGSWGYYLQGNGAQHEIDRAGSELSIHLDCPVHYPAYGKRLDECRCGVTFPVFAVDGALASGDWTLIDKQHKEGYRPDTIAYTA